MGTDNRGRTNGGKTEISVLLNPETGPVVLSASRSLTSQVQLVILWPKGARGAPRGGIIHQSRERESLQIENLGEIQKNRKLKQGKLVGAPRGNSKGNLKQPDGQASPVQQKWGWASNPTQ